MPKKVRIPAKRADRSVRWTLEVSADTRKGAADAPATRGKRTATAQRTTARTPARRAASARDKKPAAKKRPLRAKTPQPAAAMTPLDQNAPVRLRPTVLAMAAGAVVVVVALVFARDTSLRASAAVNRDADMATSSDVAIRPASAIVAPASRVATPVAVTASARPAAPPAVAEKANRVDTANAPTSAGPTGVALRPMPVAMAARAEEPAAPASVEPGAPPVESNPTADRVSQPSVTITGCLEVTAEGDQFRLTDTEGDGAPKSRGWRSGFLRKRPAAVELSELRDPAAARRYVGHRVVATGLLASRALRVRSLQSAGSVCD